VADVQEEYNENNSVNGKNEMHGVPDEVGAADIIHRKMMTGLKKYGSGDYTVFSEASQMKCSVRRVDHPLEDPGQSLP